ncbi:uncharacterized protein LOC120010516 [Tripterygium wilfordii]|uniref:uncharacterized protein LOC120010516 n=1 Tax=Tripterygium wilfordii TaxID=458696 RepID=UPI0018F83C4D|nr:uncharacterized protein LOC120010516 [Tripterygium wilfordii]
MGLRICKPVTTTVYEAGTSNTEMASVARKLDALGKLTSQPEVNPKTHEDANAITVLQSGKKEKPKVEEYAPKVPFPSRLAPTKKGKYNRDIFEELCTNKRKMGDHEEIFLSEETSAILQKKLLSKLKDPGDLKPTSITLQLADRSLVHPFGQVEDVLVNVGRGFMATTNTIIDVKMGVLTMIVFDKTIQFRLFEAMRHSDDAKTYFWVDVVDRRVDVEVHKNDKIIALEVLFVRDVERTVDNDTQEVIKMFEASPSYQYKWRPTFENLRDSPNTKKLAPSIESPPELELKPLPIDL